MKLKKIFSVVILFSLIMCLGITANATTVASGTCGANVIWTLDNEGTLTISGTGEMTSNPWAYIQTSILIENVIIEEGVTTISSWTFAYYDGLITIPKSMTSIEEYAFYDSSFYVSYKGSGKEWNSIDMKGSNRYYLEQALQCTDTCNILSGVVPKKAVIDNDVNTVAFTVPNNLSDFTLDINVGTLGATWELYDSEDAKTSISKDISSPRDGKTITRYIKVTSADGQNSEIFGATFYRNTKTSVVPVISIDNSGNVTITAPNCTIYYTTNGEDPDTTRLDIFLIGYNDVATFSAKSEATIKAIAYENGKNEPSDIVTAKVPAYLRVTLTKTDFYYNYDNTCECSFKITSNKEVTGDFIIAVYDENNRLIGIKSTEITVANEKTTGGTISVNGTPHTYKAFFWSSLDGMTPLCNSIDGTVE